MHMYWAAITRVHMPLYITLLRHLILNGKLSTRDAPISRNDRTKGIAGHNNRRIAEARNSQ
jgi:hypothetical protein